MILQTTKYRTKKNFFVGFFCSCKTYLVYFLEKCTSFRPGWEFFFFKHYLNADFYNLFILYNLNSKDKKKFKLY